MSEKHAKDDSPPGVKELGVKVQPGGVATEDRPTPANEVVGKESTVVMKNGVPVDKSGKPIAGPTHHAGQLNLAAMREAIRRKGSVLYKGTLYSRVEDLPQLEQLAQTDEQKKAARAALEAEQSAIQNRLKAMDEEDKAATTAKK